jgi:hypothetical protein
MCCFRVDKEDPPDVFDRGFVMSKIDMETRTVAEDAS